MLESDGSAISQQCQYEGKQAPEASSLTSRLKILQTKAESDTDVQFVEAFVSLLPPKRVAAVLK